MRIPEFDERSIPYRLVGLSALRAFFGMKPASIRTVETTIGVVELATFCADIEFPGLPSWDAVLPTGRGELYVRTVDRFADGSRPQSADPVYFALGNRHPLLRFSYDPLRRAFADPDGLYQTLKDARDAARWASRRGPLDDTREIAVGEMDAIEAALVGSHVPIVPSGYPGTVPHQLPTEDLPSAWHRMLLRRVLSGPYAWRGLDILYRSGYVRNALPELAKMNSTDHSKEGHPEGNVWKHTLETLKYRKTPDLEVGLALLLHDSGKPYASSEGRKRFSAHAEIGADLARRFLTRLGFARDTIERVTWLVRNHMMPGALDRLPDNRREPLMASADFPQLLELYRCDLSSTYRGPEGYYRACRVYRRYLKKARSLDRERIGRELVELYVE